MEAATTSIHPEISLHFNPREIAKAARSQNRRRRLAELLAAIHDHERRIGAVGRRGHDLVLYRRTREIVGGVEGGAR